MSFHLEDLLHMLPNNQSMVEVQSLLVEQANKKLEELQEMASWGDQIYEDHGINI